MNEMILFFAEFLLILREALPNPFAASVFSDKNGLESSKHKRYLQRWLRRKFKTVQFSLV